MVYNAMIVNDYNWYIRVLRLGCDSVRCIQRVTSGNL